MYHYKVVPVASMLCVVIIVYSAQDSFCEVAIVGIRESYSLVCIREFPERLPSVHQGVSIETDSQGVWNGGEAVWNGGGMVWNGDRSVQNDTQHKSASNTHKIPLRKRCTASDELDVIQLQTAREEPTSDPSVLLKLYQFLSLGYSARLTSSPYIREILSNCGTTSEAQNYRRSYILEGF